MKKYCILFLFQIAALALFAGTTGNIRGQIENLDDGMSIGGATIIARSNSLQGEEVTLSDEKGRYTLTGLPPGTYVITALFADAVSERTGVEVAVDKTVQIDIHLSMSGAKGEVYTIEEEAPNVDVASSTVQVTVSKEYIDNVPMGRDRNFDQAMSVSPSSGGDAFGTAVGGATSPENAYVIDGVNTTDPSKGLMGTRMVMEFIDEFDVKEGGYGAEFGHSTGGLVNAVTKGGGNELHGSFFTYYRPGFLEATPKVVETLGNSIRRTSLLDFYLSTGFELGGPIIKDKLWFHIGFAPEMERTLWRRSIWAINSDDNGLNMPLKKDGNYVMDEILSGPRAPVDYPGFAVAYQYTSKLTHLIDKDNRHSLSLRGAPTTFTGAVSNSLDPDSPYRTMGAEPGSFDFNQLSGNVVSAVYNYAGKYMNDKLKFEGVLGWHRQINHYSPANEELLDQPRISFSNKEYNLTDFEPWSGEGLDPCSFYFSDASGNDTHTMCRVQNYTRGGFGGIERVRLDRISQKLALTQLFDFAGLHQVKFGVDFEQILSLLDRRLSGGSTFVDNGVYFRRRQFAVDGEPMNGWFDALTGTANYALFLQDSWNPIPNLTLNFGLRWEAQDFYGVKSPQERDKLEQKFGIYDNFAPRVGGVWDFLDNGHSRFFVHYGRYFETIPTDLNERAFGGEGLRMSFYKREGCTSEGNGQGSKLKPWEVTNPAIQCPADDTRKPVTLGGEDSIVAPGLQGQYSDEMVVGFDLELFSSWVLGITGIYRSLGRVIEDLSTDDGETYIFANPGEFDVNRLDDLNKEAASVADASERSKLLHRNSLLGEINTFPKPVRDHYSIQFKLDKKLSDHFMILGTYVLSWTWGNYPGLFSANNGQLDPNLTSQFDLKSLLANRMGYLPQDRRHRLKLSGFYEIPLQDYGVPTPLTFTIGASFQLQSGGPIDVLGAHEVYGANEVFILPRGSGGRKPWTWALDLNLAASYDVTKYISGEFFVGLFNVTNNQQAIALDDTYTYDTVAPIKGGKVNQLKYLKNAQGNPVRVNPNYKNAVAYQSPFGMQVGFKVKF